MKIAAVLGAGALNIHRFRLVSISSLCVSAKLHSTIYPCEPFLVDGRLAGRRAGAEKCAWMSLLNFRWDNFDDESESGQQRRCTAWPTSESTPRCLLFKFPVAQSGSFSGFCFFFLSVSMQVAVWWNTGKQALFLSWCCCWNYPARESIVWRNNATAQTQFSKQIIFNKEKMRIKNRLRNFNTKFFDREHNNISQQPSIGLIASQSRRWLTLMKEKKMDYAKNEVNCATWIAHFECECADTAAQSEPMVAWNANEKVCNSFTRFAGASNFHFVLPFSHSKILKSNDG